VNLTDAFREQTLSPIAKKCCENGTWRFWPGASFGR
jgi:hypothetical protein